MNKGTEREREKRQTVIAGRERERKRKEKAREGGRGVFLLVQSPAGCLCCRVIRETE